MRVLILFLVLLNLAFFFWFPEQRPHPAAIAPEPPHARQLVLLAERNPGDQDFDIRKPDSEALPKAGETAVENASDGKTPPDTAPKKLAEEKLCRTVGPFFDDAAVKKAVRRLAAADYEVRIRVGDIQAPAGYWVYLPAMPSEEARAIVADLDTQGMKDYFIGKDNVVSLGIFSDRSKAMVRRNRIAEMGYPAMLDRRYRNRKVFWLDLEDSGKPLLINPVWAELTQEDRTIAAQQVSCE